MDWLDKIASALGLNPTRLRWRWHRLRERSAQTARSLENRGRAVTYQNKLCPGCGLTVAADEKSCPRCGRRLLGAAATRASRLLRVLVPEGAYTYTSFFVVANVAFYLAMLMRSGGVASLGQGIDARVIVRFGAWTVPLLARGELWRLVTPIFLHFGLLHLIFNCLWLLQLGPLVEEAYGRSRFLVIYLVTGVAGFATSVLWRWQAWQETPIPGGGASGVVFGLIGLALTAGYLRKSRAGAQFRGGLVKWALYGLVFSLLPGVDLAAHLGGGAAGALLGLVLADRGSARRTPDRLWLGLELLGLLVLCGSFALVVARP